MEKGFLCFVANVLGVDASVLSLDTEYNSIPEWDSLKQIQLVAEICEEYHVDIPINLLPEIKTLRNLYGFIDK